ncbi:cationic amino acid transporter 3 isoform X1, partial [Brachionus plicatilis]
ISATLGSGIYVLSGVVITKYSGPAVLLSFIFAAIATLLSGLCYAELGSKVPRSGSAYIYIYVTIGEFLGFIMGWDLILEYVIGVSAATNALSQYINSLTGNKIKMALMESMPLNISSLAPYPDFLAFALTILILLLLLIGVKESTFLNKLFTALNILIILLIAICGATKADFNNWKVTLTNGSNSSIGPYACPVGSSRCGKGGFIPFGMSGVISGAAKCFYAYIGFDTIASAGEEAKRPKRNIPLSIIITLIIVTTLYCFLSSVITLMIPYNLLNPNIPLPEAFEYADLKWAKYIVSIGAMVSLCTCLYASMFPLPRIIYGKLKQKLLPKFNTPYIACIASGLLSGLLATFLDLNELVDMMSIGTLLAYSLVAVCVTILRYTPPNINAQNSSKIRIKSVGKANFFAVLFNPRSECCESTSKIVNIFCAIQVISITMICVLVSSTENFQIYIIIILIALALIVLLSVIVIWRQPQNKEITTFKAPLVPLLPAINLFLNIYLTTSLTAASWIRFFVWFLIGFVVYFIYGVHKSKENSVRRSILCPCVIKTKMNKNNGTEFDDRDQNLTDIEFF